MALRAGYKGFKKLISPLILNRPGTIEIDSDALNAELDKIYYTRSEQAIQGSVNFCPMFSDYTKNGVTFDVDDDGVISLSGTTATADTNTGVQFVLKKGTYYLKGAPAGSSLGVYDMYVMKISGTTIIAREYDGSTENKFTLESDTEVYVAVRVKQGSIDTTKKFKPMIALSNNAVYAPFTKTNAILTSDVATLSGSAADQKTAINAIITAATEAADFAAFKTAMGSITPVTRSAAPAATREVTEEVIEEPVTTKKTTRKKSTATADAEKEGE